MGVSNTLIPEGLVLGAESRELPPRRHQVKVVRNEVYEPSPLLILRNITYLTWHKETEYCTVFVRSNVKYSKTRAYFVLLKKLVNKKSYK